MTGNVTLTDTEAKIEGRGRVKQCDETHKERCDCGAPCWCECTTDIAALRVSRTRERRLRSLANTWESQADDYPTEGHYAAVAVRLCARELRAALSEEAPHA